MAAASAVRPIWSQQVHTGHMRVRFVLVLAACAVAVVLLAAGLALIATVSCLSLGLPRSPEAEAGEEVSTFRAALAGFSVLRSSPASIVLLVIMSLEFVITGAVDILGVAYAQDQLGLGDTAAGLVVAGPGIGTLIGASVLTGVAQRRYLAAFIAGAAVVQGLLFALVYAALRPQATSERGLQSVRHLAVPFGPFLALGAVEWLLWHRWLLARLPAV